MLVDAKSFLKKNGISEDDKNFIFIKELLKDNLKYTYIFTIFHYQQNVSLLELNDLLNKLISLKDHLHKLEINDITTYRDFKLLKENLFILERKILLKKFTNQLPKKLEIQFEKFNFLKDFSKIEEFFKLNKEHQKDFISNVSRYKDQKDLLKNLKAFVKITQSKKDIFTNISKYFWFK